MAFLKVEDYVIFILTLIFCLGIGLYNSLRGNTQKTTRQFLIGSENMAAVPVALSLMVSFESGIMMLGVPVEVYLFGMQWYMSTIGSFVGQILTMVLILPLQWHLSSTSMYKYLELRFKSHGLRLFATTLSLISLTNYLGNVIFVPAITLEMVTDIPMEVSIVSLTVIVLVYTIIGGFKAVIWTDVFQAILMFVGLFSVIIKGTIEAGGITNSWSRIIEKGRFNMLDFDPDPTQRQSFWSLFIGGMLSGIRLQVSQPTYQRIKATPSVQVAKRMFFIAISLSLFISGLAVISGAIMFAYYDVIGCDPLTAKQVRNQNQLVAKLVLDIFADTPCLPGIFLAALFSASLSTMSSLLSGMSALFWEDIVKPHCKPMSDKKAIRIAQLSVVLFGGLAVFVAFVITGMEGPVSQILEITGACTGGATVGIMMLGWLVPTANSLTNIGTISDDFGNQLDSKGAIIGGCAACVFVGWVSLGKILSPGIRKYDKLEPASTINCPNITLFTDTAAYLNTTDVVLNGTYTSLTTLSPPVPLASGPQGLDVLYSLSYKWLLPVGLVLVLAVGSITSRFRAREPVDPGLVVPLHDYLRWCIPKNILRKLGCEVKYPGITEEKEIDLAESIGPLVSSPENGSPTTNGTNPC